MTLLMKGKKCIQCAEVLEERIMPIWDNQIGYFCPECKYIYTAREYEKLYTDYSQLYKDRAAHADIFDIVDIDDAIEIGNIGSKTNQSSEMSEELRKLLQEEEVVNEVQVDYEKEVEERD